MKADLEGTCDRSPVYYIQKEDGSLCKVSKVKSENVLLIASPKQDNSDLEYHRCSNFSKSRFSSLDSHHLEFIRISFMVIPQLALFCFNFVDDKLD